MVYLYHSDDLKLFIAGFILFPTVNITMMCCITEMINLDLTETSANTIKNADLAHASCTKHLHRPGISVSGNNKLVWNQTFNLTPSQRRLEYVDLSNAYGSGELHSSVENVCPSVQTNAVTHTPHSGITIVFCYPSSDLHYKLLSVLLFD